MGDLLVRGYQWLDTGYFRKKRPDGAEACAWNELVHASDVRAELARLRVERDALAAEVENERAIGKAMARKAADLAAEVEGLKRAAESATADRDALHADWDRAFGRRSFGEVAEEVERLRSEFVKEARRAITFGDIVHTQVLVMRAAVVAGELESPEDGLRWIANTLFGPGHYPDLDEARALGGAQALFDKEMAEHEVFRAAHPAPTLDAAREAGK